MEWQAFEAEVRAVAASVWAAPCTAERVNGVKCDAVIKIKTDHWILIEISKESNLSKLRVDLAKFASIKPALLAHGVYAECYFITTKEPSSLKETGTGLNVSVHTLETFASKHLGSAQYVYQRQRLPFGSAVDPDTGDADTKPYTPIQYLDDGGNPYSVKSIADALRAGRHIVLLGEFGTGKSRCVKEVFDHMVSEFDAFPPVGLNLRDYWGYQQFSPIIVSHLESLGLSDFSDPFIRSLRRGLHPLLLDGFDEIGSQSWSGEPDRLREIRMKSNEGVRQLMDACPGAGVLLSGREHYFNNSQEMRDCLGLKDGYLLLRCPDEFTDVEAAAYIKARVGLDVIPEWMPKKPLVCQLLARLDPAEIVNIQTNVTGEVEFFESVFDAICRRETRIKATVSADVLRQILLRLADLTRIQGESVESITPAEINKAFYDSAGYAPLDESAIMLQRLPYLGLVGSGTADRRFIDQYAKDGLRGLSAGVSFNNHNEAAARQPWVQALGDFGVQVLSAKIPSAQQAQKYLKYASSHGNNQIGCDYVAVQNLSTDDKIDYGSTLITSGTIKTLSFVGSVSSRLTLSNVFIDRVTIEDATFQDVFFQNCIINVLEGIGSRSALPDVFSKDCVIGEFQPALTTSRISELNLSDAHKTLLALLKKLFFQPGGGRQEEALLRGAEAYWDGDAADSALAYLQSNRLILKTKGSHGIVYVPQRRYTTRMSRILDLRSNSQDELWDRLNA